MDRQKDTNTPTMREHETIVDKMSQISRRQFIIGAAAAGAAIAASGGIYYVLEGNKTNEGAEKLSVDSSQVLEIDDFEKEDSLEAYVSQTREIDLAYNTLVHVNGSTYASILEPTETGSPLVTASLISLSTADKTRILKSAITQERNFEIYDFRGNEKGFVWTESNIFTGQIYVYTAPIDTDLSSNVIRVLELNSESSLPNIELFENTAWIQVAPKETSSSSKSALYKIDIGSDASKLENVLTSKSFATAPSYTKEGIVVTPRNDNYTSRFDIRLLDGKAGTLKDILTLPQSMTPQDASYGGTGFSFSFYGNYDYGDGISSLGTYAQMTLGEALQDESLLSRDERIKTESNVNWLHFARNPLCAPVWLGSIIAFKSTSSIALFKPAEKKYALISADEGADDYGVWLCSTGNADKLVTINNIDYTPLSGDAIKSCTLRIYSA